MNTEPEFKQWEDYCDRVWNRDVPRLVPRLQELQVSKQRDLSECDVLLAQIIEDNDVDESESSIIYINKDIIHFDAQVQSQVHLRLRSYFASVERIFPLQEKCPYCNVKLHTWQQEELGKDGDTLDGVSTGALETCPNCNYWTWSFLEQGYMGRSGLLAYAYTHFLGKVRTFDEVLPEGCAEEIATWIRRNPKRWHTINPTKLEKLVADIFRANDSHVEVTHVGRPDDGGVDVIYIDSEKKQWLIQVKRREKPQSVEAVETIRNLLGTMVLENSNYGAVVSTADHFSYQAYKAVNRAKERGMLINLIDRRALDHMLTGLIVDRPWLKPLYPVFPEFIDQLLAKFPSNHWNRPKLF